MTWFKAKANEQNPRVANISITGEIGASWWSDDSVAASSFMREVKALGELDEIILDINSPGGSVADGITIANYLQAHKAKVTANVLGQASSIASVITAAADEVNMGLGAWMMVHQPWTVAIGNADDLRALAGDLDKIRDGIMSHYVARVGEDKREEMLALVQAETILSAEEAVELGLADKLLVETKAAASISTLTRAMAAAAVEAKARIQPPEPAGIDELRNQYPEQIAAIENKAREGVDISASVQAATTQALSDERTRVTDIIKACQTTGQPQLMEKLIDNGMESKQASEYIFDVAAASSNGQHINNNHSPESGSGPGIDHNAIYARRNNRKPKA